MKHTNLNIYQLLLLATERCSLKYLFLKINENPSRSSFLKNAAGCTPPTLLKMDPFIGIFQGFSYHHQLKSNYISKF